MKIRSLSVGLLVIGITVLCIPSNGIAAKEYVLKEHGYYIDIPDGWEVLDASRHDFVSFTDATHRAVFQIKSFEPHAVSSVNEIYQYMKKALKSEGDVVRFMYNGTEAVLADWTFEASGYSSRGYFIFLYIRKQPIMLTGFTTTDEYNAMHDFLLSCLDSFAPALRTVMKPGPITQFYKQFPGTNRQSVPVSVLGTQKTIMIDPESLEASQVLIEREARVLSAYEENRNDAWRRYYRMIYRDSFARLKPVYQAVSEEIRKRKIDKEELPEKLLYWIQTFEYARTNTFSDLLAPIASAVRATGDCDARGLLYVILLRYFGIDSILLVSSQYQHSVVGVDTPGKGARYTYDDKNYLIAETTDRVSIGLIPQEMANPKGWVPVEFKHRSN
jgi:hypothetical protein